MSQNWKIHAIKTKPCRNTQFVFIDKTRVYKGLPSYCAERERKRKQFLKKERKKETDKLECDNFDNHISVAQDITLI